VGGAGVHCPPCAVSERVRVPGLADGHAGEPVTVEGPRGHHLARVSRVRVGDAVVLFDGTGIECDGTVTALRGDTVTVTTGPRRAGVTGDRASVIWLQGIPKGDKLEAIVRQATELGVLAVWPVYTQRSVPVPRAGGEAARTERLLRVAEEAARQCGRADVPFVAMPVRLEAALEALEARSPVLRLVAWESAVEPLTSVSGAPAGPCAVLAGPEGGLSAEEVSLCRAHGFVPVSLGPRILRAETVAPAVLGALAVLRGDLAMR